MKIQTIGEYTIEINSNVELEEKEINHIHWRLSKGETKGTIAREGENVTWSGGCQ